MALTSESYIDGKGAKHSAETRRKKRCYCDFCTEAYWAREALRGSIQPNKVFEPVDWSEVAHVMVGSRKRCVT